LTDMPSCTRGHVCQVSLVPSTDMQESTRGTLLDREGCRDTRERHKRETQERDTRERHKTETQERDRRKRHTPETIRGTLPYILERGQLLHILVAVGHVDEGPFVAQLVQVTRVVPE